MTEGTPHSESPFGPMKKLLKRRPIADRRSQNPIPERLYGLDIDMEIHVHDIAPMKPSEDQLSKDELLWNNELAKDMKERAIQHAKCSCFNCQREVTLIAHEKVFNGTSYSKGVLVPALEKQYYASAKEVSRFLPEIRIWEKPHN